MEIKKATFVISNTDYQKCPPATLPEYAFIGRSNVGKSSLINMLCNRKGLAKISVQPGKTQTINHFLVDDEWYLVDLPGYGYAKRSKTSREKWKKMIGEYLTNRVNLVYTFILVDLRIPPQNNDLEVISRFGESELPMAIIFTKHDKLKPDEATRNIDTYQKELLNSWESLPPVFISSAKTALGRDEILSFVEHNNKVFASMA
ncbi:MAG: YihA family ribosome biogenesis GTP-binding protein [Bacteroidales bacterium]|nr:YihA family ribosome biogenesis GTP-binding protein [Bacteroidales bacterium]